MAQVHVLCVADQRVLEEPTIERAVIKRLNFSGLLLCGSCQMAVENDVAFDRFEFKNSWWPDGVFTNWRTTSDWCEFQVGDEDVGSVLANVIKRVAHQFLEGAELS